MDLKYLLLSHIYSFPIVYYSHTGAVYFTPVVNIRPGAATAGLLKEVVDRETYL